MLPPAVPGRLHRIACEAGELTVYDAGSGPPLLLVHSINAAASSAEMLPLQKHFAATRRVFCVDLPGFGLSARHDIPYSPSLMSAAVDATVQFIRGLCGNAPLDAAALSLSCEYLAQSARRWPSLYRGIALIGPTGFRGRSARRGAPDSDRGIGWVYRLLRAFDDGSWAFQQLTKPKVIRYFLRRTWGSKQIDDALWQYDIETAKQPGARFAPLRFLAGYLFSGDIHETYQAVTVPVWMSHGIRGDFVDYRLKTLVEDRPNWQFTVYPTGALPHFELPQRFCADYQRFLDATTGAAEALTDAPSAVESRY
jgi:pimeloyl-ACP methyl ester carboxylesterase